MAVKDLVAQVRAAQVEAMESLTDEEKAELLEEKDALMNQYKDRLEIHLQNKTELTDDEIDAIVNRAENVIRTTTREEWQEAAETWRNILEERRQNNNTDDDEPTE